MTSVKCDVITIKLINCIYLAIYLRRGATLVSYYNANQPSSESNEGDGTRLAAGQVHEGEVGRARGGKGETLPEECGPLLPL